MGEFNNIDSNAISWYEFKENSSILYLGNKEDKLYKCLKAQNNSIDTNVKENAYDYIIMVDYNIDIKILLEKIKYLKNDGIILLGFNNAFGISNFVTYNCEERISPLDETSSKSLSIKTIKDVLQQNGFIYSNTYLPFPNIDRVDMVCNKNLDNISNKLDKYFTKYEDNLVLLTDEIRLLRKISEYNIDLFTNLANSYILELSKVPINTEIKYVSFNNYRKEEYQLTTIIKNNVVEKKPSTTKAIHNINRIGQNLEYLKKYDVEILDRYEDGKLYSIFMKDKDTLDIELGNNFNNEEFVINVLQKLREILEKNSIKHNDENKKEYNEILKNQNDDILSRFNYLEYAFYDMVPKNCFYKDEKFYFFDQEWMEKYLPVEFIIYRSIINSYDLVKNINVDDLLNKLNLFEYKELFEKLDGYLRDKVLDKNKFEYLTKKHRKMYEEIYDKQVMERQIADYKINDEKQSKFIKDLQEDNEKKQNYITHLEESSKKHNKLF